MACRDQAAFNGLGLDPLNIDATAIIKHTNPCGCAEQETLVESYHRAFSCDPVSAYGGIVGCNATVTAAMARAVSELFLEVVVAPDYEPAALEVFQAKKNVRLLELAADSESFQVVMLVIDQLKRLAAPAPDEVLRKRLTHVFRNGHPNSRNRLQQTFKDWDRISRKPHKPEAA